MYGNIKTTFAVACCIATTQAMQLETQASYTCTTTSDRNKSDLPDFASILSAGQKWTDPQFSHNDEALFWKSRGEARPQGLDDVSNLEWKRISETSLKNNMLWGSDGITVDDVRQGMLGNCWYKAAASSMAEVPGRLEKIFHNTDNKLNSAGIYAVDFYSLGVPHTVIVDDYLPMMHNGEKYQTVFAEMTKDKSMWPAILEKAFAKYHGNYGHTEGGNS